MNPVGGGKEGEKPAPDGCVLVAIADKAHTSKFRVDVPFTWGWIPNTQIHKTWALIVSPQSRWWDRPDSNRHHVGLCGPDALPFALLSHMGRPAPRMGAAILLLGD